MSEDLKPWEIASKQQSEPDLKPWEEAESKKKISDKGSDNTYQTLKNGGSGGLNSLTNGNPKPIVPTVLIGKAKDEAKAKIEARKAQTIKENTTPTKKPDGGVGTSLMKGLASFNESIFKVPRYLYDLAAIPQNAIAELTNTPELRADYDNVAQGKVNPLSVIDRIGDYYKNSADYYESKKEKFDKGVFDSIKDGDYVNAGKQVLNNLAESAPSIAGMYATGGVGNAAKAGKIGKTLLNALPFASSRNSELDANPDIPDYIKPLNSALYGLSEVVFDQEFGTKAILDDVIDSFGREGREVAVTKAKDFVSGYLTNAIKKVQPLTSGVKNSLEEVSTQYSQNLVDRLTIDPEKDVLEGLVDAAIIGGVTGAGIQSLGMGSNAVYDTKNKTKLNEAVARRNDLIADIDNPNLPDEVKDEFTKELERTNDKIAKISDDAETKFNGLPEKEQQQALEIQDKIELLEASLADESISESSKETISNQIEKFQDDLDVLHETATILENPDSEAQITKEAQEAEQKLSEGGDQVEYEQKMNELTQRAEAISTNEAQIPVEEQVQPTETVTEPLGDNIPQEAPVESPIEPQDTQVIETTETEEPAPTERENTVSDDFSSIAHKSIQSDEVKNTLNNIERETGRTLTEEEKEYNRTKLLDAVNHGKEVVDKAKEEFGDQYVSKLLNYLDDNQKTLSTEQRSLITISLELDLERQIQEQPDNVLTLEKQLKLVRDISTKNQRSAAIATGYGRLRQIARVGYDLSQVTDQFFSTSQTESKRKIERAIQSTADEINKEAENQSLENETIDSDTQTAIQEGVDKAVNEIYEKLSTKRKEKADKAIAALDKIQKKLRSKTYDASIGVPIAIIDAGITTIKAAIKAGVSVADAVELGVNKIKQKYGKEWKNESRFRKDMLDGFKEEGVEIKTGKRIISPEQHRKMYIKRLEKDIQDLDSQIEAGQKTVVIKEDRYKQNEEINNLRSVKSEKQDELARLDPEYANRRELKSKMDSAQKSLEEHERRIKDKEFESKGRSPKEVDPSLKSLRDKRDSVKKQFEQQKKAYEDSLVTQEMKDEYEVEKRISQLNKSIEGLRDKLNGKSEPSTSEKSLWTKEIGDLESERAKIRKELSEKRKSERPIPEPKEKVALTDKQRLSNAKERVKERIETIRSEIANKERELKSQRKPVQEDAELTRLKAEEASLKSLRDKYLTETDNGSKEAKTIESKSRKLSDEIADINRQIQQGEKDARAAKKDPIDDPKLAKLRAEKAARLAILDQLDPSPKETVKAALVDNGFGREITVTVNELDANGNPIKDSEGNNKKVKEKRQIIDWKKLAGEEGSVDKIRDNVENYLKDKGYSDGEVIRISEGFVDEYNNLRGSIIQKSLDELNRQNTRKEPVDTKTSAKRLAELYNYGLFEKEADEYDYLLNKALGLSDFGQEAFAKAKVLAQSLSDLYSSSSNGRKISELGLREAVRNVNDKISDLLRQVAFKESNGIFKAATLSAEYMNLAQRALLNSLKQIIENPLSCRIQRAFTNIGFRLDNSENKALRLNRRELGAVIYEDIVRNGALPYGEITTPYINRSQLENWLNKQSDNKVYHTSVTWMMGRAYLEGADSMHKAALTEKYFTYNLIKILTDRNNPNRMSKEDAVNYVSERLTGQNFEDAMKTAKELVEKVNSKAGTKVIADNDQSIRRIAQDIVKDALVEGKKITIKQIESSYKAAYKAAGYDLGHEANNPISKMVGSRASAIDNQINQAIKEKKWNEAAAYTFASILSKNILNPFVGGGTNWVVLTLQKTGLDPVSPLFDYARKSNNKLDLTSEDGIKNMQKSLELNLRSKNTNTRFFVGAAASLITYAAFRASGKDEELDEWLKSNDWARKYFNVFAPQALILMLSIRNKDMGSYFSNLLNIKTDTNRDLKDFVMNANGFDSNRKVKQDKASGSLGALLGSKVGTPVIPWRVVRDVQNVYLGVNKKEVIKPDYSSSGFLNGFFRAGLVDYMGLRPKGDDFSDLREIRTQVGEDKVIFELTDAQVKERQGYIDDFIKENGSQIEQALKQSGQKPEEIAKKIKSLSNSYARSMVLAGNINSDGTFKLKEVQRSEGD